MQKYLRARTSLSPMLTRARDCFCGGWGRRLVKDDVNHPFLVPLYDSILLSIRNNVSIICQDVQNVIYIDLFRTWA